MKIKREYKIDRASIFGLVYEPTECPLCKRAIKPDLLHSSIFCGNDNAKYISELFLCRACDRTFVAQSAYVSASWTDSQGHYYSDNMGFASQLLYIGPQMFEPQKFDDKIEKLSPQFAKIYNQALAAESYGLDEIAGIGYRKALEFLVKDYCIHANPDKEEEIKAARLSACINKFIDNPQIKDLSTRAAWIGNDETHYIRKQEGRDVNDLKSFIQAMIYFVGMSLIAEDAKSIPPA